MDGQISHPLLFHFCANSFIQFVLFCFVLNRPLIRDLNSGDIHIFPKVLNQSIYNNSFL